AALARLLQLGDVPVAQPVEPVAARAVATQVVDPDGLEKVELVGAQVVFDDAHPHRGAPSPSPRPGGLASRRPCHPAAQSPAARPRGPVPRRPAPAGGRLAETGPGYTDGGLPARAGVRYLPPVGGSPPPSGRQTGRGLPTGAPDGGSRGRR